MLSNLSVWTTTPVAEWTIGWLEESAHPTCMSCPKREGAWIMQQTTLYVVGLE